MASAPGDILIYLDRYGESSINIRLRGRVMAVTACDESLYHAWPPVCLFYLCLAI